MVFVVTRLRAAANPVLLPKPEPRAMREHVVVPSIRGRDVACAQRSGVRYRVDALQPLDFGNGPLGVHPSQYLTERQAGQFGSASRKTLTEGFVFLRSICQSIRQPSVCNARWQCRADTPVRRF